MKNNFATANGNGKNYVGGIVATQDGDPKSAGNDCRQTAAATATNITTDENGKRLIVLFFFTDRIIRMLRTNNN